MEMLVQQLYWTNIINVLIQQYLTESTICILWHKEFDFGLEAKFSSEKYSSFVIIDRFKENFGDFSEHESKQQFFIDNFIVFDDLIIRLTLAIENLHCTTFFAFGDDIPVFINAFRNASQYSVWRSTKNKFIFALHSKEKPPHFLQHDFFDEQSSLLFVENNRSNSALFYLKTNRYTGIKEDSRKSLFLLDIFDAENGTFLYGSNLFPDKSRKLQGRELVIAGLHYRPTVALDYGPQYNTRDISFEDSAKGMVKIDGTDMRTFITFCELYNCTIQINSAESDDWGSVYPNMSGFGTLGMVAKGTAEIAIGAMYTWVDIYQVLGMSDYLSRHGITCLVPAPKRLTSWLLPLEPFQSILWAAVMVNLIVEIISLLLMHKVESFLGENRQSWWPSFMFGFVLTLKLFVSQSCDEKIFSVSMSVFLCACFFTDMILTSIYGGGLASILTVPSLEEAADTVERLRSHKLTWVGDSDAWVFSLMEANDSHTTQLVEQFNSHTEEELRNMTMTKKVGFALERLAFGHYALGDYFTEDSLQHLKIMLEDIYFQYTVTFTARNWPLLERYNSLLCMWHSSGFDKYWEWRVVANTMNSQLQKMVSASMLGTNDDLGPVSLDMSNFAGILIIWVLGISIAIFAFIGELIYKHIWPSK